MNGLLLRGGRKLVIAIVGGSVLVVGIIMIVTPGPAVVVIPAGLAILGTEFVWARRILKRMKAQAEALGRSIAGAVRERDETSVADEPNDEDRTPRGG
jgi:uncharacterized protein (TIGR02611 family)